MQLTIEITDEQHHHIKSSAELEGKSIRDFLLEKTMADSGGSPDEDDEIKELMEFLEPRIQAAKRGDVSMVSISEIKERTIRKNKVKNEKVSTVFSGDL